jgi:type I restriction enzyme S subunit
MKVNVGNDLYLKGRIGWKGLSKDEYLDKSDYRIINGYSLKDGYIDWDIAGYISEERYEESPEIKLEKNDILISKDGTIGKVGIVRNLVSPTTVASGIFVLRNIIADRLDTEYLFQYLKSSHFKAFINAVKASGSTIIHLYQRDLAKLEIDVPQLPIQKAISSILFSLDSKIELNNRINAALEAMAKTLYDYWFVQFDFPDKNGKPFKTSGGKMVWNEELKREIPEGWENGFFGDYAKLKGGFAFKSSWWTETGLPVIKIKDINEDYTLSLKNCSCVNEDKYGIAKNYEVHPGDVVIALTGATVGKYGIVTKSEKQVLVNQRVGFFKLGEMPLKKLPFLINSLNQEYFRKTVFVLASGAAQPNISTDQIDAIPLIIPKGEIIKRYNESCKSFYEVIIKNQTENQKLTELRDWLLPMLMNGQMKVS